MKIVVNRVSLKAGVPMMYPGSSSLTQKLIRRSQKDMENVYLYLRNLEKLEELKKRRELGDEELFNFLSGKVAALNDRLFPEETRGYDLNFVRLEFVSLQRRLRRLKRKMVEQLSQEHQHSPHKSVCVEDQLWIPLSDRDE